MARAKAPAPSIPREWLLRGITCEPGKELYVEAKTRDEMKILFRQFVLERERLKLTFPVEASQLVLTQTFKSRRFWVVIKKEAQSPLVGFEKDTNTGELRKVQIAVESNVEGEVEYPPPTFPMQSDIDARKRRIWLMSKDGYTAKEAEEIEGSPLTPDERIFFYTEKSEGEDNADD